MNLRERQLKSGGKCGRVATQHHIVMKVSRTHSIGGNLGELAATLQWARALKWPSLQHAWVWIELELRPTVVAAAVGCGVTACGGMRSGLA